MMLMILMVIGRVVPKEGKSTKHQWGWWRESKFFFHLLLAVWSFLYLKSRNQARIISIRNFLSLFLNWCLPLWQKQNLACYSFAIILQSKLLSGTPVTWKNYFIFRTCFHPGSIWVIQGESESITRESRKWKWHFTIRLQLNKEDTIRLSVKFASCTLL